MSLSQYLPSVKWNDVAPLYNPSKPCVVALMLCDYVIAYGGHVIGKDRTKQIKYTGYKS